MSVETKKNNIIFLKSKDLHPTGRDRTSHHTLSNTSGVRVGGTDHGTILAHERGAVLSLDAGMARHPDGQGDWW